MKELQGLSLRNVEVTIFSGKKKLYQEFGEMLFTHFGVSGPAVLSASSIVGKKLEKQPLTMQIDLKPALSEEQLDARILRDFNAAKNKSLYFGKKDGRLFTNKSSSYCISSVTLDARTPSNPKKIIIRECAKPSEMPPKPNKSVVLRFP